MHVNDPQPTPSHPVANQSMPIEPSMMEGRKIALLDLFTSSAILKTLHSAQLKFKEEVIIPLRASFSPKALDIHSTPHEISTASPQEVAFIQKLSEQKEGINLAFIPIEKNGKLHLVPLKEGGKAHLEQPFFVVITQENGRQAIVLKNENLKHFQNLSPRLEIDQSLHPYDILLVEEALYEIIEKALGEHVTLHATQSNGKAAATGLTIEQQRQQVNLKPPVAVKNPTHYGMHPSRALLEMKTTLQSLERARKEEDKNIKDDRDKLDQKKEIIRHDIKKEEIKKEALKSQVLSSFIEEERTDGVEVIDSEKGEMTKEREESKKIKEKFVSSDPDSPYVMDNTQEIKPL